MSPGARHRARGWNVLRLLGLAGPSLALVCACAGGLGQSGPPPSGPGGDACRIVPREREDDAAFRRAGGELQAKFLTSVGIGASITDEQEQTIHRTFQTLADANQACAMLNSTMVCLATNGHEDLAWALCRSASARCAPGLPPEQACPDAARGGSVVQQSSGSRIQIVNGSSNNVQMVNGR